MPLQGIAELLPTPITLDTISHSALFLREGWSSEEHCYKLCSELLKQRNRRESTTWEDAIKHEHDSARQQCLQDEYETANLEAANVRPARCPGEYLIGACCRAFIAKLLRFDSGTHTDGDRWSSKVLWDKEPSVTPVYGESTTVT
ncbi:hypothetical protein DOTSEDRAFT_33358 [Dothistroma septosporum NZE10]|uniref:Uncharacterized protein n=1 Tax=Dothistroma septosporum (strain NZE10 / CBS 128990) TaxID=675120 RepID=N1PWM8_DOTSN|nr:hypothetical protein DOTSEDRAFT_33358 [Dothistroma septosporum NZE10]